MLHCQHHNSAYSFLDSRHAVVVESGASTSVLIDLHRHVCTEAISQVCQYVSIRAPLDSPAAESCCQDKH